MECGVWSVECGVRSVECGVRSVDWGMGRVGFEVWSVRLRGVAGWSVECSVECGAWSVECRVWSVESAVSASACAVNILFDNQRFGRGSH